MSLTSLSAISGALSGIAALCAGGWLAAAAAQKGELAVKNAWVRASIGGSSVSAAYFVLDNRGSVEERLVGVSTERAGHAMLHRSAIENGVMKMRPVPAITIPAGGEVSLAPGGIHVMLMRIEPPLEVGEAISLTLEFEGAGKRVITAPVRAAAPSG